MGLDYNDFDFISEIYFLLDRYTIMTPPSIRQIEDDTAKRVVHLTNCAAHIKHLLSLDVKHSELPPEQVLSYNRITQRFVLDLEAFLDAYDQGRLGISEELHEDLVRSLERYKSFYRNKLMADFPRWPDPIIVADVGDSFQDPILIEDAPISQPIGEEGPISDPIIPPVPVDDDDDDDDEEMLVLPFRGNHRVPLHEINDDDDDVSGEVSDPGDDDDDDDDDDDEVEEVVEVTPLKASQVRHIEPVRRGRRFHYRPVRPRKIFKPSGGVFIK